MSESTPEAKGTPQSSGSENKKTELTGEKKVAKATPESPPQKEGADKTEVKKPPAPKPKPKPAPKPEPRKFILSSSPHIRDEESVSRIMRNVTLSLVPAMLAATWIFGLRSLGLVALGMASAVLTEWAIYKIFKMEGSVSDMSALLTGMLVSFNIPAGTPWWIPVVGSMFAIAIAKMPFGGLGYNPLNPALVGRAFLLASWPLHMTKAWLPAFWWKQPGYNFFTWKVDPASFIVDGATYATPLEMTKTALRTVRNPEGLPDDVIQSAMVNLQNVADRLIDLMVGTVGGCIGETSAILIILGGLYMIFKKYIDWRVPVSFIAVVAIGGWLFGGSKGAFTGDPLFHIFAGGLILGAFYMATDMVTSPMTKKGRIIFGVGCGLITLMIRMIGGYPEGVSYAILLMNLTVPLIDRYTVPRRFGHIKPATKEA